jgi:acetolactate synthase-1/2/3 large subunit
VDLATGPRRTAASAIVETLVAHGVDRIFCVPGESFLGLVDALQSAAPAIQLISARHEASAGFLAVSDAMLTGRIGVAMVSRGPGGSNVAIAVHAAEEDAVPLLVIVGDVETREHGASPLQEVDWRQTYGDMAKAVVDLRDEVRAAEAVARAVHLATSGTPGPVVLVCPEDILDRPCAAPALGPRPLARLGLAAEDHAAIEDCLVRAQRPVLLTGSLTLGDATTLALWQFAEAWALPMVATHRRPHHAPADQPAFAAYMGNRAPKPLMDVLRDADLIVALGDRLDDASSQNHSFPAAPQAAQTLIHVWPDPGELGTLRQPDHACALSVDEFLAAFREAPPVRPDREAWHRSIHEIYRALVSVPPASVDAGVNPGALVKALSDAADSDAVIACDAGNFSSFVHRWWRFRGGQRFVGLRHGSMGIGVPGAVAASLRYPERQAFAFVGDGGALMTGQELATAVQLGARPVVTVIDNGGWGSIRMHQARRYPGREAATILHNPDFVAWAESFGAKALRVANVTEMEGAVRHALGHDGPVLIHCHAARNLTTAWVSDAAGR